MPIPHSEDMFIPMLRLVNDKKEHFIRDVVNDLAKELNVSDEELEIMLPSGNNKLFQNRVAWTKSHLVFAGYLVGTKRGYFKITPDGLAVLSKNTKSLTLKDLRDTPTYTSWIKRWKESKKELKTNDASSDEISSDQTPTELFESSYQTIRRALALELLAKVKSSTPRFFEHLVIDLLVKMGYGGSLRDARAIGKSGDGGIDGIIKEDKLGLDVIYIQAKRWDTVVGRPELQKFVGALAGQGAKKGIFITTSDFTSDALNYQPKNETKIVLVDGKQLSEYMMDFEVGVSKDKSYDIKKIDYDYFEEE
jgi:restriction system protein